MLSLIQSEFWFPIALTQRNPTNKTDLWLNQMLSDQLAYWNQCWRLLSSSGTRSDCPPCGSTMTCLCAICAILPFSFLPNSRPMEDLMPFFFGCLWRESWLLATLLSALASASREATILKTRTQRKNKNEIIAIFKLENDESQWCLTPSFALFCRNMSLCEVFAAFHKLPLLQLIYSCQLLKTNLNTVAIFCDLNAKKCPDHLYEC